MNKKELKPCPFCGGRVYPMYWSRTESFFIFHYKTRKQCFIKQFELDGDLKSFKEATEAWNRRVDG